MYTPNEKRYEKMVYNHYSDNGSVYYYDSLISGTENVFWKSKYQLWAWYVTGEMACS